MLSMSSSRLCRGRWDISSMELFCPKELLLFVLLNASYPLKLLLFIRLNLLSPTSIIQLPVRSGSFRLRIISQQMMNLSDPIEIMQYHKFRNVSKSADFL